MIWLIFLTLALVRYILCSILSSDIIDFNYVKFLQLFELENHPSRKIEACIIHFSFRGFLRKLKASSSTHEP
jgi:hypothetical protein